MSDTSKPLGNTPNEAVFAALQDSGDRRWFLRTLGVAGLTAAGLGANHVRNHSDISFMQRVPSRQAAHVPTASPTHAATQSPATQATAETVSVDPTALPSRSRVVRGGRASTTQQMAELLSQVPEVNGQRVFKVNFNGSGDAIADAVKEQRRRNLNINIVGGNGIKEDGLGRQIIEHLNRVFQEESIPNIKFVYEPDFNLCNLAFNLGTITYVSTEPVGNYIQVRPIYDQDEIPAYNPEKPWEELPRVLVSIFDNGRRNQIGFMFLNGRHYPIIDQYEAAMVDAYAFSLVREDLTKALTGMFNVDSLSKFSDLVHQWPYLPPTQAERVAPRTGDAPTIGRK